MDKRLLMALSLSFLVVLAWSVLFAPKPAPKGPAAGAEHVDAPPSGAAQAEAPAPATAGAGAGDASFVPQGTVLGEDAPRTLELALGTPGQRGSYFARFENRGARLMELRLGDYYDRERLDEEQRLDREHWVALCSSIQSAGASTGSLVWRSGASSRPYEREPLDQALWKMRELGAGEDPSGWPGVLFELAPGTGLRFEKRVLFEPNTYRVHVRLALENQSLAEAERALGFQFTPAEIVPQESGDKFYVEPQAVCAAQSASDYTNRRRPKLGVQLRNDKGSVRQGTFSVPSEITRFAGVHNKYFAMLMRGADEAALGSLRGAQWRAVYDDAWAAANPEKREQGWHFLATDVLLELRIPAQGQTRAWDYVLFAGPKDREVLVGDFEPHAVLVDEDLGFFNGIARALLAVLGFFEGLVKNWGIAIILLTVSVRALLFPVNRRSQTSMSRYSAKMKRLQPQIEEIKKRFEKDPQKQRAAQAELMQKEGAFPPLGGCLPMFVQLPVFFGLYQALRTSFDLRQAPFYGWITDLSKPDRLLRLDLHTGLPFIGHIEFLNVLPPLMVVLWVAQQMTMPKPADEQAAKMQRMMMFMPVFMGLFLYNYAAGLSLYMITQSTLGIFEQHVIKRVWPVDESEPVKKSTGFMAKLTERAQAMQREAEARQRRAQPKRPRR